MKPNKLLCLTRVSVRRKFKQAALWVFVRTWTRLHTVTWRNMEGTMPRATVVTQPERFDLETVEGGFILLRRMTYGEKLQKDQEAMKLRFDMSTAGNEGGMDAEIAMINEFATLAELSKCVMDHNLEDEHGNKLDFRKAEDVRKLDPRVGDEIQALLAELNDFERKARKARVEKGK